MRGANLFQKGSFVSGYFNSLILCAELSSFLFGEGEFRRLPEPQSLILVGSGAP